jgi:hypothetical protein
VEGFFKTPMPDPITGPMADNPTIINSCVIAFSCLFFLPHQKSLLFMKPTPKSINVEKEPSLDLILLLCAGTKRSALFQRYVKRKTSLLQAAQPVVYIVFIDIEYFLDKIIICRKLKIVINY